MESEQLQQQFFKHLKSTLAPHISLSETVAEHLNISTDSAYRRIRGEKPITLEEIQKLCKQFHISLDSLLSLDSTSTVFYGNWVDDKIFDFEKYLTDMLAQLEQVNKASSKEMYHDSKDIPLFHHFQFEELAAFKYFFWMKTILQYPDYAKKKFEDHELKKTIQTTGKKIITAYNKIPSTEIWSAETINSTIRQIEFCRESGMFRKKETVIILYEQFEALITHIEAQAEAGEKFYINDSPSGEKNFSLYYNEVMLGHNTIVTVTDDSKAVFINHGVLNYMFTHDEAFCNNTLKSLQNIIRKSILISSVGEKERNKFFLGLKEKISQKKAEANAA